MATEDKCEHCNGLIQFDGRCYLCNEKEDE